MGLVSGNRAVHREDECFVSKVAGHSVAGRVTPEKPTLESSATFGRKQSTSMHDALDEVNSRQLSLWRSFDQKAPKLVVESWFSDFVGSIAKSRHDEIQGRHDVALPAECP